MERLGSSIPQNFGLLSVIPATPTIKHDNASVQLAKLTKIEKIHVDSHEILQKLNLEKLQPALNLCPPAFRFMSLNHLLKYLTIITFNKSLKGDQSKLEANLLDLGDLIINIYKGEVQRKELLFNDLSLNAIKTIAKESDQESMKVFMLSLHDCLEEVISSNFPKASNGYWLPEEKNFFNVTISALLDENRTVFKNQQEKEYSRIFLGTFFPLAAKTAFETSDYINHRTTNILRDLITKKLPSLLKASTLHSYVDEKGKQLAAWLTQNYLLQQQEELKKLGAQQTTYFENHVKPSLDVLAPSYMSKLLEEGQMGSLKDEVDKFSSECEILCHSLAQYQEEASPNLLKLSCFIERFEIYLHWSGKDYDGRINLNMFRNNFPSLQSKKDNIESYFDGFHSWCTALADTKGHDVFLSWQNFKQKNLKEILPPNASLEDTMLTEEIISDLKIVRKLLTCQRLQLRSHIGLIDYYKELNDNKIEIELTDSTDSIELTIHEIGSKNLAISEGSENLETEETSSELPSNVEYSPLHQSLLNAFHLPLKHRLAREAIKDSRQAYKNLLTELTIPPQGCETFHTGSHAHALVRFTCTMIEELVTALVIEKENPQKYDHRLLKHTITSNLQSYGLPDKLVHAAEVSNQLEQRMRYLFTDSSETESPILDLLRKSQRVTTTQERDEVLSDIYSFVRDNLQAVGSVLDISEMSYDNIWIIDSTKNSQINSPSVQMANQLASDLSEVKELLNHLLSINPPNDTLSHSFVGNHLADAANLLDLARVRLERNSETSVGYAELSTLIPLAIESLMIAVAGRPNGTLNLQTMDRKKMRHNLLEMFYGNRIEHLFMQYLGNQRLWHSDYMKESRSLLALTRYAHIQQAIKGDKLDRTLVKQVKQATVKPISNFQDDWTVVRGKCSKKTHRSQHLLKFDLLKRTQRGINLAKDLCQLLDKMNNVTS